MFLENEVKDHNERCEIITSDINLIKEEELILQTKIDNIPTDIIDIDQVITQITIKAEEVETLTKDIQDYNKKLTQNSKVLDKIETFEKSFSIAEYKEKQKELDQIFDDLQTLDRELEKVNNKFENNNKKVQLLNEVPCGTQYSNCKFIKDAHNASGLVVDLKEQIQKLNEDRKTKELKVEDLNEEQTKRYISQFEQLQEKRKSCETDNLKLELEKGKLENLILTNNAEIEALKRKEKDYNDNKDLIENKETFTKELSKVKKTLSKKEKERQECQDKLLEFYKEHGSLEQKIKSLEEKKEDLHNLQEEYSAYDLFMRCMHPNGIAYDIIKKQLPVINEEIAKILANVVDFEAFFETDDKHLRIFIKHARHEPRPIEMGSGAEKTLVAMAIRLALLTVSSLPKSDIFILDEPGTALDVENMDGFISILELIKTYFKTVILISHLDGLKDCVDQQIMIDKKEGFAHISI